MRQIISLKLSADLVQMDRSPIDMDLKKNSQKSPSTAMILLRKLIHAAY
jgi:hypothetical protein